jgi:hypothetical protein
MITHRSIGKQGRLGNQMFQYASTIGIAKKYNYDYCFHNNHVLNSYFNLSYQLCDYNVIKNFKDIEDAGPNTEYHDNTTFHGYFQSENYFKHCSNFIKKEFEFKDNIKKTVDVWLGNKTYIAMHIRRSDYLSKSDFHTNLSLEWYNTAKQYFKDQNVLIFSDDKPWCKESFPIDTLSPFESDGEDLYAMTKCTGHIIANSSFSWWGAYLANSKKIIMPKEWFTRSIDTETYKMNNGIFL